MAQVDSGKLFGKLNETTRRTLEGGLGLCQSRTHSQFEIEHWLLKILEFGNTDLEIIIKQFDLDPTRLITDLGKSLDRFNTGSSRLPEISPNVFQLVKTAWMVGSVDLNEGVVRSGHLVCGLLSDDYLVRIAVGASEEFKKINLENLKTGFHAYLKNSAETSQSVSSAGPVATGSGSGGKPTGPTDTPNLDQYTVDLTQRAKNGEIDPVLGRDPEIRQITDILTRRRQNNPILTGEAGVGKTAVVEGFALRLANGDVTPSLKNVSLRSLDLGLLQAGAGVKGEFENRLKNVINEVKASPTPIIMFIDEATR